MDVTKVEEKITKKTKAIIPIHLYGQCVDMDVINEIAKRHKLKVIEDTAQGTGTLYKGRKAGSIGDVGCISFFPTKKAIFVSFFRLRDFLYGTRTDAPF